MAAVRHTEETPPTSLTDAKDATGSGVATIYYKL